MDPSIPLEIEPSKSSRMNLNTILMAVMLAVGGLVLNGTIESGKKLSAIEASQVTRVEMESKNREIDAKIEGMRSESISRTRDSDLRLESVRAEFASIRVDLARLQVEKQQKPQP